MVGAVSFQPYVSSYQYTGYPRMRTQDMQTQAGHSAPASSAVGETAASVGKSGSAEPAIGVRSTLSAGHTAGIIGVAAGRAADPETPVEPIGAASKVESGTAGSANYGIPFMRAGMDPAELAVRMRIQYVGTQPGEESGAEAAELDLPGNSADKAAEAGLPGTASKAGQTNVPGNDSDEDAPKVAGTDVEDTQKTMNETECKTCKERKYQDGSDDPGVSFKSPTHIDPGQTASAVRGHELEHVVRERAKAEKEGRRVISQSVTMQTGICPECGRVYVAGGVTRTTTAADTKPQETPKDPKWILNSAA